CFRTSRSLAINLESPAMKAARYRDVRIRPNFSYGAGVYGPVQRIRVNGTAAGTTIEEVTESDAMRSDNEASANIYPNPNSGDMVNINLFGVEGAVAVRVIDATGRIVYTETYFVEGSLNTIATFAEPLAAGVYNIEFNSNGNVTTERMMVTRQ
ncbi:MAG: T9SS type A sorting domain-containing protein, partial [Flavobacteriales bacterium]